MPVTLGTRWHGGGTGWSLIVQNPAAARRRQLKAPIPKKLFHELTQAADSDAWVRVGHTVTGLG
jgi:hypothetical protein